MKTTLLALFIFGLFTVAFAQSGQPVSTHSAHVYVYSVKKHLTGIGLHPTLSCGRNVIEKIPNGSYSSFEVAPGNYLLRVAQMSLFDERQMDFVADKTYYIRLSVIGRGAARIELDDVTKDEAVSAMSTLRPISEITTDPCSE